MPHGASPDAQSRFMAWTHCNLAKGLRGFSPLAFSGEFHKLSLKVLLTEHGIICNRYDARVV